jgi:hypothetical protein
LQEACAVNNLPFSPNRITRTQVEEIAVQASFSSAMRIAIQSPDSLDLTGIDRPPRDHVWFINKRTPFPFPQPLGRLVMLAQVTSNLTGNLSGVSLIVSIVALLIALFSLPASIKQYLVWIRDVALWLALAFVAAIVLKAGLQKANRDGKSISQVAIEAFSKAGVNETSAADEVHKSATKN